MKEETLTEWGRARAAPKAGVGTQGQWTAAATGNSDGVSRQE